MKILVVRRDNIGDLVCTTPLLAALRHRYPEAWIGALVNSYNAPVLAGNPHLDEIIAYKKLKHLGEEDSALSALAGRVTALWRLRRLRLDVVVLATPGMAARGVKLARWLKPGRIAGFDDGSPRTRVLDLRVPLASLREPHEVDRVFALARLFGIEGKPPRLVLVPQPGEVDRARDQIAPGAGPIVGVHISARRPAQRWPAARFAELIRALRERHGARVMLLWSPGPSDQPQHPGDDAKAMEIRNLLQSESTVAAYPTVRLESLIAALAACDAVICSDGGAMHLAAALRKPVVALFGDSSVERWRPWGVPHRIVHPESRDVADAQVADVLDAYADLASTISVPTP